MGQIDPDLYRERKRLKKRKREKLKQKLLHEEKKKKKKHKCVDSHCKHKKHHKKHRKHKKHHHSKEVVEEQEKIEAFNGEEAEENSTETNDTEFSEYQIVPNPEDEVTMDDIIESKKSKVRSSRFEVKREKLTRHLFLAGKVQEDKRPPGIVREQKQDERVPSGEAAVAMVGKGLQASEGEGPLQKAVLQGDPARQREHNGWGFRRFSVNWKTGQALHRPHRSHVGNLRHDGRQGQVVLPSGRNGRLPAQSEVSSKLHGSRARR